MEKIDIGNIMDSCINAAKFKVFNWVRPPESIREQVQKEQLMYKTRLGICSNCPIFDGATCNSSRSITVEGEAKFGCGCLMKCKAALEDNHCPVGKW